MFLNKFYMHAGNPGPEILILNNEDENYHFNCISRAIEDEKVRVIERIDRSFDDLLSRICEE